MQHKTILIGPFKYTRQLRQILNQHFKKKVHINTRLRNYSKLTQTITLEDLYKQVEQSIIQPTPFRIPSNMKYLLFIKKIYNQNQSKFSLRDCARLWQKAKQNL